MTSDDPPKEKTSSELTDEHLAELLKRDAKDNSLRYSAMGMLPKRYVRPESDLLGDYG